MVKQLSRRKPRGTAIIFRYNRCGILALFIINPDIKANTKAEMNKESNPITSNMALIARKAFSPGCVSRKAEPYAS
jgi:hypothetical protein